MFDNRQSISAKRVLLKKYRKKSNASISKVKKIYENNLEFFRSSVVSIQNKAKIISDKNIDDEIYEKYKVLLRKTDETEIIYKLRLEELFKCIQHNLLDTINKRESYVCDVNKFYSFIEDISKKINEDGIDLNFCVFKNGVNLNLKDVESKREYKQLIACSSKTDFIRRHIIYEMYYNSYRILSLDQGKDFLIGSLEDQVYERFQDVVENLIAIDNDLPINRLNECKNQRNDFAGVTETKYGALIFMTRDSENMKQISWKDEDGIIENE